MSDSIVRLKLDSEEYSGKIKKAREELLQMEQQCRKVGGTMEIVDKDQLTVAQSLGKLETSARGVRGKISELTTAYTDLRSMYNRMTSEEKTSPFGQAMAQSLQSLKQRTMESTEEFKKINGEIGNSQNYVGGIKNAFEELTSSLGINIAKISAFSIALGMAKEAINIAKDALQSNRQELAVWGKLSADNESLYKGFLSSINNGDISGYVSNMNNIIQKADQAFNSLVRLKKLNLYNSPKIAAIDAAIARNNAMERRGVFIPAADGSKNAYGLKPGQKLTPQFRANIARQNKWLVRIRTQFAMKEYSETGKTIKSLQARQAAIHGIPLSDYIKGTSDFNSLNKYESLGKKWAQWRNTHSRVAIKNGNTGEISYHYRNNDSQNPYRRFKGWYTLPDTDESARQIIDLQTSQQENASKIYGISARAYRAGNSAESALEESQTKKTISNKTSAINVTQKIKSEKDEYIPLVGSYDELTKKLQELRKEWNAVDNDKSRSDLQKQIDDVTASMEKMEGKTLPESVVKNYTDMTSSNISGFISEINKKIENSNIGSSVWNSLTANKQQAEEFKKLLSDTVTAGLSTDQLQEVWSNISSGQSDPSGMFIAKKRLEDLNSTNLTGDSNKEDSLKTFSNAASAISNITGGLQSIGFKLPAELNNGINAVQGLISVVNGVSTIINLFGAGAMATNTGAVIGNTVAIGGLITALTATDIFKSIGSAAGFLGNIALFSGGGTVHAASGLRVPGSNWSGDKVPAMVNSGELILNAAQQNNVADLIYNSRQSSQQSSTSRPYLNAETIWLGLNNFGRRTGRGEIMTSKGK